MAEGARPRLPKSVSFAVSRPNEYTNWGWPRRYSVGGSGGFGMVGWGPLLLTWCWPTWDEAAVSADADGPPSAPIGPE